MLSVLAKGEAYGLQILDRANQVGEVVSDGPLGLLACRSRVVAVELLQLLQGEH